MIGKRLGKEAVAKGHTGFCSRHGHIGTERSCRLFGREVLDHFDDRNFSPLFFSDIMDAYQ
jgi:hypothetical protein